MRGRLVWLARYCEFLANCFRNLAISSLDGGQFVSQVLQWNTKALDFKASSNSSCVNLTVWLWLCGHTISSLTRLFILSFLEVGHSPLHYRQPMYRGTGAVT